MKIVKRKDLVVGTEYYYDKTKQGVGIFIKRDGEFISFKNQENTYTSYGVNVEGLVQFYLHGGGFEEVNPVKDLDYWRENAEEDYEKVPISVLRYISELEMRLDYNGVDYTSCGVCGGDSSNCDGC